MRKQEVVEMNEIKQTNIPEKKFRAGPISVTIWQNKGRSETGEVVFKTVSFQRSYKDKDGKWQNSGSLRVNDLPKATVALQKAYEYLVLNGPQESPEVYSIEDVI